MVGDKRSTVFLVRPLERGVVGVVVADLRGVRALGVAFEAESCPCSAFSVVVIEAVSSFLWGVAPAFANVGVVNPVALVWTCFCDSSLVMSGTGSSVFNEYPLCGSILGNADVASILVSFFSESVCNGVEVKLGLVLLPINGRLAAVCLGVAEMVKGTVVAESLMGDFGGLFGTPVANELDRLPPNCPNPKLDRGVWDSVVFASVPNPMVLSAFKAVVDENKSPLVIGCSMSIHISALRLTTL